MCLMSFKGDGPVLFTSILLAEQLKCPILKITRTDTERELTNSHNYRDYGVRQICQKCGIIPLTEICLRI